jgi:branched-chain amino acid aminotransferase
MNSAGRICESSIANVFVITGEKTFTPPLTEGCVAGVMRRWLISNFRIEEKELAVEDLLSADELFLTNSIQPVRWVEHFRDKTFGNEKVKEIFKLLVARIASQ